MHLVKDENGNVMSHTHDGSTHTHEHHHTHEHSHTDATQNHGHQHSHECDHSCAGGCDNADGCKNETVALLSYMLDHNTHHAAELDQMAANLEKLGMNMAAKQIREAVSDFQKGNLRLSLALTTVKEELKEV